MGPAAMKIKDTRGRVEKQMPSLLQNKAPIKMTGKSKRGVANTAHPEAPPTRHETRKERVGSYTQQQVRSPTYRISHDDMKRGIHLNSLALTRCPGCGLLNLSEKTEGNGTTLVCTTCKILLNTLQKTARKRQCNIIHAIFSPDHETEPRLTPATGTKDINTTNTRSTARDPKIPTMRNNPEDNRKNEMVDEYSDEEVESRGEEDQDVSLKNLLLSMQEQMTKVSQKVGGFEKQLSESREDMSQMADKIEAVKSQQEVAREEARKEALSTKHSLQEVRDINEHLAKEQTKALQKIQEQVLREVQGNILGAQPNGPMDLEKESNETGEWARKARTPMHTENAGDRNAILPRYSEMESRTERPKTKTTNTNGTLSLVYVADWKDESIGKVKNALRAEIGQASNVAASHSGENRNSKYWPDVNAVRHINQYGTDSESPNRPLMEIACTAEKAEMVMDFFKKHGTTVFDGDLNPCIDPTFLEGDEDGDKDALARRMKNHMVRLLLAWWKTANYIFSQDTKLFYKSALSQLLSGRDKLFEWPAFITAIHIDASGVNDRKDHPRIWFEYKEGYEFLNDERAKSTTKVQVQSFSSLKTVTPTPASKRKRQAAHSGDDDSNDIEPEVDQRPGADTSTRAQHQEEETMEDTEDQISVAKKLYDTPARKGSQVDKTAKTVRTPEVANRSATDKEMMLQFSIAGTPLAADDLRMVNSRAGANRR